MLRGLHPQHEPSGAGSSSGDNTVLEPSFRSLSPLPIIVGANTCEDYHTLVQNDPKRRMPVNYIPFKHQVPGSSPVWAAQRYDERSLELTPAAFLCCRAVSVWHDTKTPAGRKLLRYIYQIRIPVVWIASLNQDID